MIMEGLVFAPSGRVAKASSTLPDDAPLEVRGRLPYVSRGRRSEAGRCPGRSLDERWRDRSALDVGASTGGFTDCLLQSGRPARLRSGRGPWPAAPPPASGLGGVTVMEKTNARHPYGTCRNSWIWSVIDVSFISAEPGRFRRPWTTFRAVVHIRRPGA